MKKLIILLSVIITAAACERGPKGPQGPPGPAGADAEVESFIITVYPADWQEEGSIGSSNYSYTAAYIVPEFTPDIVDFGLVQAYVASEFGWSAMPFTLTEGTYHTDVNYAYDYDILTFIVKDSDLQTQPFANPIDFKVVIAREGVGKIEFENALKRLEAADLQPL